MLTLRLLGGTRVTSLPPSMMRPEFGISKPPSMRSVVDLPQPEGPSRVTNLPASMLEVQVVHGHVLAVALGDIFELDDGLHQRVLARRVRYSA